MNLFNKALLMEMSADILSQLYPALPILSGSVIPLSNYGKTMYDAAIAWAEYSIVANFLPVQDAPFLVGNYGTVTVIDEAVPRMVPIMVEACKVEFNDLAFQREYQMNGLDGVTSLYTMQLTAKVRAWDEKCAAVLLYGNPTLGIPGLLYNSSIPTITSLVNFTSATPAAMLAEMLRLSSFVATNSRNIFTPTNFSIPQDLYTLLNTTTFNTNSSDSVLKVLNERLVDMAPYKQLGKVVSVTSVETFNDDKIGTLLPSDPNEIGAAVWDLEEFLSPDNSESYNQSMAGLASAHRGGYAGIVAKRPNSGLIVRFTY